MKIQALSSLLYISTTAAFAPCASITNVAVSSALNAEKGIASSRRSFFANVSSSTAVIAIVGMNVGVSPASAGTDVEDFLKSGQVAMPMGVSGQAGKSRPETGIVFRDGAEVSRDTKTGNVLTEIVLRSESSDPTAALITFSSPWTLAKGSLFDVECRNAEGGDSAFVSVTTKANGKSVEDLPSSFFTKNLFSPTGRFSFYGQPTDVKVKKSYMSGNNRVIELGFSILSQSTGAEIPRLAIVVAAIPEGEDQAIMLATSTTATRWRKGIEKDCRKTAESFNVSLSPKTGLKVRAKRNYDEFGTL
eukprot:scaffold485_cov241-Chaetoceros_neogracile.AAC.10